MSTTPRTSLALPNASRLVPPSEFRERASAVGVDVNAQAIDAIGDFLAVLLAMNELMNLTAIVEPALAWERHALDAMTLVPHLAKLPGGSRVADLGSGGGVPAIPLAIFRPDLHFTLVESTQKKANFLEAVALRLGLANVSVAADRAEQVARGPAKGTFDAVTARALARLSVLVPLAAPLLRPGGRMLFIKGQRASEELTEAGHVMRKSRVSHRETVDTPTGKIVVLQSQTAERR